MSVKYQVFVSSTFSDLRDERDQVIKAILEMGHVPVGMEMFSAADEEQWKMIARQIDQSDYYIVLVAHRYGTVTPEGVSYTEKEYNYAVSSKVPVLGFVLDDAAQWPVARIDGDAAARESLELFKEKVKRKPVSFWKSADDLYGRVSIALSKAFSIQPRPGWIRTTAGPGPEVVAELTRLSLENGMLRSKLEALENKEKLDSVVAIEEAIELMRYRQYSISVWYSDGKGWEDEGTRNLLTIFGDLAPALITEDSTDSMSSVIATQSTPDTTRRLRKDWSFPSNGLDAILADLQSLGLIQPSPRKHAVADTKKYWTLTAFGTSVNAHTRVRRMEVSRARARGNNSDA